jgi:hypothetical protein
VGAEGPLSDGATFSNSDHSSHIRFAGAFARTELLCLRAIQTSERLPLRYVPRLRVCRLVPESLISMIHAAYLGSRATLTTGRTNCVSLA